MYCKRCNAKLPSVSSDPVVGSDVSPEEHIEETSPVSVNTRLRRCRICRRRYDISDPNTFRGTLAISPWEILIKVLLTTVFGIVVAYFVASFQIAGASSGH